MNKRLNNRLSVRSNTHAVRFLIVFLVVLGVNSSFLFETAIAIAAPSPFRPKPPQRNNKTPKKVTNDELNAVPRDPTTYLCTLAGSSTGISTGSCR